MIDKIFNDIGSFLNKNSNKILAGAAIIGFGATIGLTIKAVDEINRDQIEEPKEVLKKAAPAIAAAAVTTTAIVANAAMNESKINKLSATAASLAASYAGYVKGSKEVFGEDAQKKIECECCKRNVIFTNGENEYTFIFAGTTKPFVSTYQRMMQCELYAKDMMATVGNVSLAELYKSLDVEYDNVCDNIGFDDEKLIEQGFYPTIGFSYSTEDAGDVKIIYVQFVSQKEWETVQDIDKVTGLPYDYRAMMFDNVGLDFIG